MTDYTTLSTEELCDMLSNTRRQMNEGRWHKMGVPQPYEEWKLAKEKEENDIVSDMGRRDAERKNNLDNLIKLLMMARKDKHETASLSYHYESGWTITFDDEWHADNVTLFVLNEGESVEEFILRVLGELQTRDDPPTGLPNVTWTWTVH